MSYVTVKVRDHTFRFHEKLYKNLMKLKKATKNDWDFKILISGDGMTRTGKSTLGSQICLILDSSFDMNRVVFRGEKLIESALNIGKRKAILYDEAKEGLDSKKAMNSYSQRIVDHFSECGTLNQYMVIVLPEFFDLNKTVALNQSVCLINCYLRGNFYRGNFGFYNRKDKRYLYIKGKKWNNYSCQSPTFQGSFTNYFPLDVEEYDKMKRENMRSGRKEESKEDMLTKFRKLDISNAFIKLKGDGYTKQQLSSMFNLTLRRVNYILMEGNRKKESKNDILPNEL